MKKVYLLLIVSLIVLSCYNGAQETTKIGNFTNELLFEKDSCKMYRFMDGGHAVYWSTCEGKTQYTTSGKNAVNVNSETINLETK